MKTVLITGAGRGIGLALTKKFSTNCKVIATYRDEKSAAPLFKLGENVIPVKADVGDEKTFAALTTELKKIGQLDFLINNAGVIGGKDRSLLDLDVDSVAGVFNVNTFGPIRVCKLAVPFMKNGGIIAQITSLMGSITDNGGGGYYDYRMSKTALNMFNKCLSIEFPDKVCLVLHPGWVQTDMGGAGATVKVEDCANGLYRIISEARPNQSGRFFDYSGRELPW